MPKIYPSDNKNIFWPSNEKTLGIVGMSPYATLEFLKIFYNLIPTKKEWEYPRVLLDMNTKIPSRGRYFELGEENPSLYISQTIKELHNQGADCILIPCNTVHILIDEWGKQSPIPIISILEAVTEEAKNYQGKIITFGTKTTKKKRIYTNLLIEKGLLATDVDDKQQNIISSIIEEIKKFGYFDDKNHLLKELLNNLDKSITTIILACTELSYIKKYLEENGFNAIDSNTALAKKAIKFIMKE